MSEIKALEKLHTAARNMAKGRNLENHEECNLLLAIADEIEAEIEREYMRLPADADGATIHVGDVVASRDWCEPREVTGFAVLCRTSDGGCVWNEPCELEHYKPRTLEDIVYEIALDSVEVVKVVNGAPVLGIDRGQLADGLEIHADEIRGLLGGDTK